MKFLHADPGKIYTIFPLLLTSKSRSLTNFTVFSSKQTRSNSCQKKALARHGRCDVYCGARETVGESSVSSGCWGEDSDHEYEWARRTPTYVAPIRFYRQAANRITARARIRLFEANSDPAILQCTGSKSHSNKTLAEVKSTSAEVSGGSSVRLLAARRPSPSRNHLQQTSF